MNGKLQTLPIGVQDFAKLRRMGHIYVDKTERLQELVTTGEWFFLSRPRRFGKSLTLSTLDAMFSGQVELFKGLAAEDWVAEQAERPATVLRFDMSKMKCDTAPNLELSLTEKLQRLAKKLKVTLISKTIEGRFEDLIEDLYEVHGPVVVLIDEYDKPILDHIADIKAAEAVREVLRSFYTVLKGCDEYLRFVMLTGISKFSKAGVFSAMNNLRDISMSESYGDIVGYTQDELGRDFSSWLDATAEKVELTRGELLKRIEDYYDGFSFDGVTKLYNPFSILHFFSEGAFANYWYKSGSPSFIVRYMKQNAIQDPDAYRHIKVDMDFADAQEIERATPESFLYQAGYLTIEEKKENALILDYPNYEVRKSLVRMYLDVVYKVRGYITLGDKLWKALEEGNLAEAVRLYNVALAGVPYADFTQQDEYFYCALFLMLLRGASIEVCGEVPTNKGRSDAVILLEERVIVLEFKLARKKSDIARLRREGMKQIETRGYAKPYDEDHRAVTSAVVIVNGKEHEAGL